VTSRIWFRPPLTHRTTTANHASRRRLTVQTWEDRAVPAAATFLVTTIADSGAGSFRRGILDANAAPNSGSPDNIAFTIPGTGVHTISPLSQLPPITDPAVIDG
jgi:hypothetical protein